MSEQLREALNCLIACKKYGEAERLLDASFSGVEPSTLPLDALDYQAALALFQERHEQVLALLEPREHELVQAPGLLQKLASAYRHLGMPVKALALLEQAISLDDGDADLQFNLGNALRDAGRSEDASVAFAASIRLGNASANAYNNLGVVLRDVDRSKAERTFRAGLALQPTSRNLAFNLSALLAESERHEEALGVLSALPEDPSDLDLIYNMALSLAGLGRTGDALERFEHVLRHDPSRTEVLAALGSCYQAAGRVQEAIDAYERGLQRDGENTELHRRISVCRRYREGDTHLLEMREIAARDDLSKDARMRIDFALAKAEEEVGRYREAFAHLMLGNEAMAAQVEPFELQGWLTHVTLMLELDRELISRSVYVSDLSKGEGLVFILGMPRSGTTLTETILSLAPGAVDLGETMAWQQVITAETDCLQRRESVKTADLQRFGDHYLSAIAMEPSKARLVTDKNLYNWRYVGLICRSLPAAKIIHCRRNPVDNLLSIYKAYFPCGNEFAFNLDHIFQMYQLHDQAMDYYIRRYPGRIIVSNYDELVQDPARLVPRLIESIGLEWNPCYLRPDVSDRSVRTASAVQVRDPIHAKSVCGWKRYELELGVVAQRFRDLGYIVD